jgi:hypothetical protein
MKRKSDFSDFVKLSVVLSRLARGNVIFRKLKIGNKLGLSCAKLSASWG